MNQQFVLHGGVPWIEPRSAPIACCGVRLRSPSPLPLWRER